MFVKFNYYQQHTTIKYKVHFNYRIRIEITNKFFNKYIYLENKLSIIISYECLFIL